MRATFLWSAKFGVHHPSCRCDQHMAALLCMHDTALPDWVYHVWWANTLYIYIYIHVTFFSWCDWHGFLCCKEAKSGFNFRRLGTSTRSSNSTSHSSLHLSSAAVLCAASTNSKWVTMPLALQSDSKLVLHSGQDFYNPCVLMTHQLKGFTFRLLFYLFSWEVLKPFHL